MKRLHKEGKATKDAVDDAKTNLAIAYLNTQLSALKYASAAEKAAKSSAALGFYADLQLTRSGDKTNINSNSSQEVASNVVANEDINISSGSLLSGETSQEIGNTNIQGNLTSINSNINITSYNNTNITATKSQSSQNTKSEGFTQTTTIGGSYGNSSIDQLISSLSAQLSKRTSKSDNNNTTYTNTNIQANNGNITITSTNNDTNITGANINANNITINTANNLNIASLQNTSTSNSKSKSYGAGGGSNSGSFNFNKSKSKYQRNWVDDQTEIVANNNLTINTTNNTDIKGAKLASNTNNLNLTTGTLTYEDIIDTETSKSSSIGLSTNISKGIYTEENSPNTRSNQPNSSQDINYYPGGSTTISATSQGYSKEQITRATIGEGTINITGNQTQDLASLNRDATKSQEITKDTITGALNIETTIDNRIIAAPFSEGARKSLVKTISNSPENMFETTKLQALLLDESAELLGKTPYIGKVTRQVTSPVEGVVDYFLENDSRLYVKDQNNKIIPITRKQLEELKSYNYLVNGVGNDKLGITDTYLNNSNYLVVRHNPTSGYLGDVIESALGKTLGTILPQTSAMANLVADDYYARKDIQYTNNLFHSQATIIGSNAQKFYNQKYMAPIFTNNPAPNLSQPNSWTNHPTLNISYTNQIDPTQSQIAFGPAISNNRWDEYAVMYLGYDREASNPNKKQSYKIKYYHDQNDFVRYLTAPEFPISYDLYTGIKKAVASPASHTAKHYIQTNPDLKQILSNQTDQEGAR